MYDNAIEIFKDLVVKAPTIPPSATTWRWRSPEGRPHKGNQRAAGCAKANPSKKEREQIQALMSKLGAG
jgi:hypothetical protein